MNQLVRQIIVTVLVLLVLGANFYIFSNLFYDTFLDQKNRHTAAMFENELFNIESTLEPEISTFIELFYSKDLVESDIFAIDHQLLARYLKYEEVDKLVLGGYLHSNYTLIATDHYMEFAYKQYAISFGVMYSKWNIVQKKLTNLLSMGWQVKVVTANGRYYHTIQPLEPLHLFITKNSVVIQLVVFYSYRNYLWVGGIPEQCMHLVRQEWWWNTTTSRSLVENTALFSAPLVVHFPQYGHHDAIFDPIELEHRHHISIPINLVYFIMEHSTSRVVYCDIGLSQKFATLHQNVIANQVESKALLEMSAINTIKTMKELSRRLYLNFWLFNGALLGWYRNCGPFVYLENMDFAVSIDQVGERNLTTLLIDLINKQNGGLNQLKLVEMYGSQNHGVHYRLEQATYENMLNSVNLVACYRSGNLYHTKRYTLIEHKHKILETNYIHPYSEICSGDYLGHKVLVPCKTLETVVNEFGPSWLTPVIQWDNVFGPTNRANQSAYTSHRGKYHKFSPAKHSNHHLVNLTYLCILCFPLALVTLWQLTKYLYRQKKVV